MLDLNQMSVFIRVVQEGSFTGAAKALGIPKSRVSRMITDLEDKLSVRLLERTTREVHATDIGLQYYSQYKPLFEEITDIHSRISDHQSEPSGLLRIAAPVGFAIDIMGKWMADFKSLYPKIDIELEFSDNEPNLVRDGFDIGFVFGHLDDSSLIARKFDDTDPVLLATPSFIKNNGPFTHPSQLTAMPWIVTGTRNGYTHACIFIHKETGERIEIQHEDAVLVNHHQVALHHTLASQGVSLGVTLFTYEHIYSGQLEVILPDWEVVQEPLHLVFPSGRHQAKKVRAFIDFFMDKSSKINEMMDEVDLQSPEDRGKLIHEHLKNSVSPPSK
jgi:DNA-binding transcriptional LysR family regulator